ncbi:MAG: hypothetical protein WAV15_04425 [Minisyncoccia bacterium]
MKESAPGVEQQEQYKKKKKLINGFGYLIREKFTNPKEKFKNPKLAAVEEDWSMVASKFYVKEISIEEVIVECDRILEKLKDIAIESGATTTDISEPNLIFCDILDKREETARIHEKDIPEH